MHGDIEHYFHRLKFDDKDSNRMMNLYISTDDGVLPGLQEKVTFTSFNYGDDHCPI